MFECGSHTDGDLLLQSVALQIYMPRARVHMFQEFTYEHSTRVDREASRRATAAQQQQRQQQKAAEEEQKGGRRQGGSKASKRKRAASITASTTSAFSPPADSEADSPVIAAISSPRGAAAANSNANSSTGPLSPECIDFGGIAAGLDDAAGYETVMGMLRRGEL